MAENKRSFLLYCDLLHMVNKLPDEIAGRLFKTILSYVNDENPEPDDVLLQIAFEPIKQQLKRDLKKWESFREKQSLNGKKGGRPRQLTDKKQPKTTQKSQAFSEKAKESQKSLNANVSVSDSVSEKGIQIPDMADFLKYGEELCKKTGLDFSSLSYSMQAKYYAWKEAGWKDGYDKPIKNWKSKFANTMPHLKKIEQPKQQTSWVNH